MGVIDLCAASLEYSRLCRIQTAESIREHHSSQLAQTMQVVYREGYNGAQMR